MSTTPSISALTDDQIIERLATDVIGWTLVEEEEYQRRLKEYEDDPWLKNNEYRRAILPQIFNPLTDWNHWRQVEEKIMEDRKILESYIEEVVGVLLTRHIVEFQKGNFSSAALMLLADLPTRCKALLAALDSIKK